VEARVKIGVVDCLPKQLVHTLVRAGHSGMNMRGRAILQVIDNPNVS
jgi:hypothetical protein